MYRRSARHFICLQNNENGAQCIEDQNSGGSSELLRKRGEVFGLLGPNGAGKTTTLRMLATLIRPDSGDAVLSGSSVVTQPEEVRRKIGFLTSELKLEDFFTPDYLYDFSLDCTVFRQTDGTPENACCLHGSAFRSLPRCALGICPRE